MSDASRDRTVGFVGLGAMGGPMARNLLKTGRPLLLYDVDPRKVTLFQALGAKVAAGPAAVAKGAAVCVSMVDTTEQTEEVIVGAGGFFAAALPDHVIVCMSTVAPCAVQRMHKQLSTKGVALIDAPVAGMIDGAERGALKAYVGGEASALEKVRGVLEAMNSEIHHVGGAGQGVMMKLINNMLAQAGRFLVIEAMVFGAKAGLDPQTMVDLIGKSTGASVVFQHAAPRLLSRDFTGIRMDIKVKDLELQTQVAKGLNVPLFMANVVQQVYMMGKAAGLAHGDPAAMVKVYERLTGVSLARA